MDEIMDMGLGWCLMEPNLVRLSGVVRDLNGVHKARAVHVSITGETDTIIEEYSDILGNFSFVFGGASQDLLRIAVLADDSDPDENSQVYDFINAKQHSTIL